jgi:hypothetical protein
MVRQLKPSGSGSCLNRAGDGAWDAEHRPISHIGTPTMPLDAVPRVYVDEIAGVVPAGGVWVCGPAVPPQDPGSGRLIFNHRDSRQATRICLSSLTDEGVDVHDELMAVVSGDTIKGTSEVDVEVGFCRYSVTETPTDHGSWVEIPVAYFEGETDLSLANLRIAIKLIQTLVGTRSMVRQLHARLDRLEQRT